MDEFKLSGVRIRMTHDELSLEYPKRKLSKYGLDGPLTTPVTELLGVVHDANGKWTVPDMVRFIVEPDQLTASPANDPWSIGHPSNDAGVKPLAPLLNALRERGIPVAREESLRAQLGVVAPTAEEQAAAVKAPLVDKRRQDLLAKVPQIADREDILEAAAVGLNMLLGVKRELRALPQRLDPDERVVALSDGSYQVKDRTHAGLVVLTDRRLMFIAEGMMSGRSSRSHWRRSRPFR